jgi:hypothetical protein
MPLRDPSSAAVVVAAVIASGLGPSERLAHAQPRPADPDPDPRADAETEAERRRAASSWLSPKERPRRTPWPVTFSTVAALAGGSRSFHGSFGLSVGSQHLFAPRLDGERRFVSFGASVFVRWYTPHPQVACGADAEPKPARPHCPATVSMGPTFRFGVVRNEGQSFEVPHERLSLAVTPFAGSEPLRDPARAGLALGARIALAITYGGSSKDLLDDADSFSESGGTLAFIALLPATLVNHLELYGEPMLLDSKLLVSAGAGIGFGL